MEREYTFAAKQILRIVLGDYFVRVRQMRDGAPYSRDSGEKATPSHARDRAGSGLAAKRARSGNDEDSGSGEGAVRTWRDTVFAQVPFRRRMAFLLYRHCQSHIRKMRFYRQLREELVVEEDASVLDRVLEHEARASDVLGALELMIEEQTERQDRVEQHLMRIEQMLVQIVPGARAPTAFSVDDDHVRVVHNVSDVFFSTPHSYGRAYVACAR